MKKTTSGFTIVELLIVIVVIAILAAISVVAYTGIQNRAASTALQSDLRNAASQLGLDHADSGSYPTGSSLPAGIGSSDGNTLYYQSESDGSGYCLTAISSRSGVSAYTLSNGGSISQGSCPGHPAGGGGGDIALTCPAGFIPVPGNPTYGTSDFCVMQYEAKNVDGVATSQAAGLPWVGISQTNAKTAAQTACDGCKLITDPEWTTIAMNVISVPSNWSGGSVGSGIISRGNNDSAAAMDGTNELSGVNKRTHTLTNGEVIWDLAGNVREWTDATITGAQPGQVGGGWGWREYTAANMEWNNLPAASRPLSSMTYTRPNGVGLLYSNPSPTGGAYGFHRGGDYGGRDTAGVLSLHLNYASIYAGSTLGFRASR